MTLTVYQCPPEHFEVLAELLTEHGLGTDWSPKHAPIEVADLEPLARGRWLEFMDNCGSSSFVDDIQDQIPAIGPITFVAHQDGVSEYDGETYYYEPELGGWFTTTNASETPMLTVHDLDDLVAKFDLRATVGDLVEAFDELTGRPWRKKFLDLNAHYNALDAEDRAAEASK